MSRLELDGLVCGYGPVRVLHGLSLYVEPGEVVALLGRNGAGKSTTLKAAMGLARVFAGSIRFKGHDLAQEPSYRRAQLGLGYVPEERRIFPELTVRENLEIARKPGTGRYPPWTIDRIYELMPPLANLENRRGGFLSGGEQQMLTIARTLMGNPEMLLLDEPTEGLAPLVVKVIGNLIDGLKNTGIAILLAEQNLRFTSQFADRAYVLESGELRLEGPMREMVDNPEVKALLAL